MRHTAFMGVICLSYLIFQLFYIPHSLLATDEFWFAHHIYQYTQHLPYQTFLPYKPVLGYYLLSIPYYFSQAVLTPLYLIKDEIALINCLFLGLTSYWLARLFHPKAVLLTLLLVLSNQLFLIYSVDIRVDMLTSWFCLISALLLLSQRPTLAGMSIALAFLISQKALWGFLAANGALSLVWLTTLRLRDTRSFFLFNLATLFTMTLYVIFWTAFSDLSTVLHSVFYEAYTQSKISWYHAIYYNCWQIIMRNGPLLFLLWPLCCFSLLIPKERPSPQRIFIATYATILLTFVVTYQQPFPYNLVLAVPAFFLLYADFFTWLHKTLSQPLTFRFSERQLFWYLSIYAISITSLILLLHLANAYFIILTIPALFSLIMHNQPSLALKANAPQAIFITLCFSGILYPLIQFALITPALNNRYQQSMIQLSHQLLQHDGDFFAGIPLLYDKDQAIPGLKNLIGPSIDYLYHHNNALLPLLLSSLYITPSTPEKIIESLQNHRIKLFINNERIMYLPLPIRRYLAMHYQHYWGSIYLYAPVVSHQINKISLQFSANYFVKSKSNNSIYIDNKKILPNGKIYLTEGIHTSKASGEYRLEFIPEEKNLSLESRFQKEAPKRMVNLKIM